MDTELPFIIKDFATLTDAMLGELQGNALNDVTDGSVVRTLTEVFARELAVCYQQLDKVYRFGYLETAEGVALDNVIALLGLKRYEAGHLEGSVTFTRRQPAPEDINIPAGTLISGRDKPLFKTIQRVTLSQGGKQVTAKVSSVEPGEEAVDAAGLSFMPRPIWGIEEVSNQVMLTLRQGAETDDEFRERARYAIHQANRGTVSSLEIAVRSLGLSEVTVQDQIEDRPGQVDIILGDAEISDALLVKVRQVVESVRPAGVKVSVLVARRIWVRLHAVLELDKDYPSHSKDEIAAGIKQSLNTYVDALSNGGRLRWSKLSSILTSHESVMVLHPAESFPKFMEIFVREEAGPEDVSAEYLLKNNDILPGSMERIGFDPETVAINLSLEPPYLDVWLDVEVNLADDQDREALEQQITEKLKNTLQPLKPGDSIPFDLLKSELPGTVTRFSIIHERNAQVFELLSSGDQDYLSKRERIQLRSVVLSGGNDG